MASDKRFQRTVQAVAEAVQIFATGTFDFAESIKQIWGPQTQPDAVETSNHLPMEGIQDVRVADQLRDRTPVSQDGDQLAINSYSHPPSMTLYDGEGALEVPLEAIVPLDMSNTQLSNDMDAVARSLDDAVRSCYECFARWQDESPFPSCLLPALVAPPCEYCTRMQIKCKMASCTMGNIIPAEEMRKMMQRKREARLHLASQNGNAPMKNERFEDLAYETSEPLGMPLSSPIVDVPQQQVGSKRAYHDIDEQQPMFKRQRLQELQRGIVRKISGGKWVQREEQDDHAAAAENGESSSSSVSSLPSGREASQVKMATNRQESSPIETSDLLPVAYKVTGENVTRLEGENDGSSSFTQKEPVEDSSSEEDDSSSSEESSDEESEDESEEQIKHQLAPEAFSQEERERIMKEAIPTDDIESGSSSSSSEDESSEEESEDESSEEDSETET
ncbi:hypothetical protein N7516_008188 [Penicillium verrucosum]|uniref:uncharacterized protein n=1 Tax=Penicillium verrucosum TaxID=60171 RepID=UPI00254525D0|nr:uncharacterized protein N7516_008188 [Penicillium verrucosum]KAJ5926415.1 hypothetical protein N7516_008188 [Penicillium verrucosum]